MLRSSNPAFGEKMFDAPSYTAIGSTQMTVSGTVTKSLFLLLLVIVPAIVAWRMFTAQSPAAIPLGLGAMVGGIIFALITMFKKQAAPVTAPLYCICEGLFLGLISVLFETAYRGIVGQAMALTFGVFAVMLLLYKARILVATPAFTRGVVAATGAICLVYLVSIVMSLFGLRMPLIHEGGLVSIGISVVIVIIAALNLVLDFDLIEQGAAAGFPRYMEWYGAFALMVTLIWLYLEVLRLLAKARRR